MLPAMNRTNQKRNEHEARLLTRVGEGDEAEPPGAARLGVLHDHAVDDLAEAREVAEKGLLNWDRFSGQVR